MIRIATLVSVLAMVSVLGCDEDTVCDEAWDIEKAAMKDACQAYDDCCYCKCALDNDCSCDESIDFTMRESGCSGEKKARAEGCVSSEENCADIWTNNVDMLCSSEG